MKTRGWLWVWHNKKRSINSFVCTHHFDTSRASQSTQMTLKNTWQCSVHSKQVLQTYNGRFMVSIPVHNQSQICHTCEIFCTVFDKISWGVGYGYILNISTSHKSLWETQDNNLSFNSVMVDISYYSIPPLINLLWETQDNNYLFLTVMVDIITLCIITVA